VTDARLRPGDLVRFDTDFVVDVTGSSVFMLVATNVATSRNATMCVLLELGAGNLLSAREHQLLRVFL